MRRYIIPNGWNSFDVSPSKGARFCIMDADGIVGVYENARPWHDFLTDTHKSQPLLMNRWVCWKPIEPLGRDYFYIKCSGYETNYSITISSEKMEGVLLKADFLAPLNKLAGFDDERIDVVMQRIAKVLSEEYNEVMP